MIHRIVIDEGASTCIMFVACWKAISSPTLSQSPMTLEAFDGRESRPYGILQCFPIRLEGKMVKVEVEVVDADLTYNLLLGRSWTYAMRAVASSLFHVICFPHQGKIVTVDQLSFFTSSSDGNVSFVEHTSVPLESVGAGLFKDPTLMGVFSLPPPNIASINMIFVRSDAWVLPPLDQPLQTPIQIHQVSSEGNMGNITQTQPIDISIKPGIVEHIHVGVTCTPKEIQLYPSLFCEFHDVFAWSYKEMPGIDPSIVVHEIPTYLGAKPVRQHLCPVHPQQAAAIKAEAEKLLKVGFIYSIPLIDWVSNIVPVTKKQGTIRVCVDYRDVN
eukprot:PITA_29891